MRFAAMIATIVLTIAAFAAWAAKRLVLDT